MSIENIYKQLRESSILYSKSFTIFEISDSDKNIDALSNLTAGKIFTLDIYQIMHGLLLNDDGSIKGLIQVMMFEDKFWLIIPNNDTEIKQYLVENLNKYGLEDITEDWEILNIEGPKSWEVLKEVIGYDILGLQFMNFMDFEEEDNEFFISRIGLGGEYGYNIFTPKNYIDKIKEKIVSQTEVPLKFDENIPAKLFDITSCEARIPNIGTYIKKGDCPIESELRWMIDFRKDDFIGKDSIDKRLENYKNRLIAFTIESDIDNESSIGDNIYLDTNSIGIIKYLTYSPQIDKYIGYALIQKEWAYSGIDKYAIKHNNSYLNIKTVSTPFFLTKSFFIEMD